MGKINVQGLASSVSACKTIAQGGLWLVHFLELMVATNGHDGCGSANVEKNLFRAPVAVFSVG